MTYSLTHTTPPASLDRVSKVHRDWKAGQSRWSRMDCYILKSQWTRLVILHLQDQVHQHRLDTTTRAQQKLYQSFSIQMDRAHWVRRSGKCCVNYNYKTQRVARWMT